MAKKAKLVEYATTRTLWRVDYSDDYGATTKDLRIAAQDLIEVLKLFRDYTGANKEFYSKDRNKHYTISKIAEQPENRIVTQRAYME